MNTQVITIDSITIKQDSEGRYSLNDLHKAAGGEDRHAPAQWMRHDQFKGLAEEIMRISTISPVVTLRGRFGGTFVVKELVYAYAMWISPQFNLKVIRAYDRLATQGVAVHENAAADLLENPMKYIEALMGQAKQMKAERDAALAQNAILKPKAQSFDSVVADRNDTITQFSRRFHGLNSMAVKASLCDLGYLHKPKNGAYRVRHMYRDKLFAATARRN